MAFCDQGVRMLRFGAPVRTKPLNGVVFHRRKIQRVSIRRRFAMNAHSSTQTVVPDKNGRFGRFGGQHVPETLVQNLRELEAEYRRAKTDPSFQVEHS